MLALNKCHDDSSALANPDHASIKAYSTNPATWDNDITPNEYMRNDQLAPKKILFTPGTDGAYSSIGS